MLKLRSFDIDYIYFAIVEIFAGEGQGEDICDRVRGGEVR